MAGEPILPENPKVPAQWLLDKKKIAISDCRMLYAGIEKPPTESLMCFSWECGDGWNDVLARLSYKVESLNLTYYPKYRVRCEAEQIKEKFGTLRAYVRVTVDPPAWRMFLAGCVKSLARRLDRLKIDCGMKKVIDRKRHTEYEYEQLTESDFNEAERGKYKCSNVEYAECNGRYYRLTAFDKYEESHMEPSKHKWFYALRKAVQRFAGAVAAWSLVEPTPEQRIIMEFVDSMVAGYVSAAERECYSVCEDCGCQIGSDWSPRCETKGWIAYLCEKCAKRRGSEYIIKHENQD